MQGLACLTGQFGSLINGPVHAEKIDKTGLASLGITPRRLSQILGTGLTVKDVISNLEGQPDLDSIGIKPGHERGISPANQPARPHRRTDQRACFHGLHDLGFVHIKGAGFSLKIKHLAPRHAINA